MDGISNDSQPTEPSSNEVAVWSVKPRTEKGIDHGGGLGVVTLGKFLIRNRLS